MRAVSVLLMAGMVLPLVPLAAQERGSSPLQLSMKRAVEIATSPEGNASIQLAVQSLKQAQERSLEARAALLPDVLVNHGVGAGTVPATDLYAVTEKKLVRITNDRPGAAVRWHAP